MGHGGIGAAEEIERDYDEWIAAHAPHAAHAADEPPLTSSCACSHSQTALWHCIPLSIPGHCGMGCRLGWAMVEIGLANVAEHGDMTEQIKAGVLIHQLEENNKTPSREHQASPG